MGPDDSDEQPTIQPGKVSRFASLARGIHAAVSRNPLAAITDVAGFGTSRSTFHEARSPRERVAPRLARPLGL
jgi:hypothetical protein